VKTPALTSAAPWAAPCALFLCALLASALPARSAEPALSLTGGVSLHTPQGATGVHPGPGWRAGFALPATIPAAELRIPLEWGFSLRTAKLRFDDSFNRATFTDLQMPFLVHGDLFGWKYAEPLVMWTPSWTLDMSTRNSDGEEITATDALRTRFNMSFGAGLQAVFHGFRLRAYTAYNLIPQIAGAEMTTSDWVLEVAVPLFTSRGNP